MKAQVVVTLKAEFPLVVLLEIAGLARSTFFYHQARLSRPDPRAALKAAITEVFTQAKARYGYRRVHTMLTRAGWQVAAKTVLKLMNALGLVCQVRRRRRYRAWSGPPGVVAANVLDRQFTVPAPNIAWVTDLTEFKIGDRKIYLSPVIDLFDRSIVAYSHGTSPTLELANSSLRQAIATLRPGQRPLVHSDQGVHYRHTGWQRILAGAGLTQSMSRRGNCLDNAIAENFFGHLKEELFHHNKFDTVEEFTTALDDYMGWFNTTRISSASGNLSPVDYRTQALTT